MSHLCQGRIVWVEQLLDPRGRNPKNRPVVVLTKNDEIETEDTLVCVVASNSSYYENPRPDDYIEIPSHPQVVMKEKLTKPTVAVCRWITEIEKTRLLESQKAGIVRKAVLETILNKVRELGERRHEI